MPVNPSGVQYSSGAVPIATPAVSAIRKFYPSNGRVFSPGGVKVITIPLAAEGQFLDAAGHSFLKFDVSCTGASAANARAGMSGGGCWGMIKRLRILSATGAQLEDIDDYNALHCLLVDMQCHIDHVRTFLKSRCGAGAVPGSGTFLKPTDQTFTLNPVCGLLAQPKYLPLLMTKGGITIELTLAENKDFLVCMDSVAEGSTLASAMAVDHDMTYEVTNMEYVAELIDFGVAFNQTFLAAMATVGGALLSSTTYRTHIGSREGGAAATAAGVSVGNTGHRGITGNGRQVHSISERAKSIKSILTVLRPLGALNTTDYDSVGYRCSGPITSYQYRIGSLVYPDAPVQCNFGEGADAGKGGSVSRNTSEPISHAYKAIGMSLSDYDHGSLMNDQNFGIAHQPLDLVSADGTEDEQAVRAKLKQQEFAVGNLRYAPVSTGAVEAATVSALSSTALMEEAFERQLGLSPIGAGAPNQVLAGIHPFFNKDSDRLSLDRRGTAVFGVTLESFAKDSSALESGLNSASQALPIEFVTDGSNNQVACRVDHFVCCDILFMFRPSGDVVSSV